MVNWLTGWTKRVKVTIDAGDIDADLINFPVLLHISTSCGINSEDISFVFDELTSDDNRKKIAVTTSDGETECYVEIEKWDDANEQAWLWVKVPDIDETTNTDLYLYYDSAHADNSTYVGDTGEEVAENVWDANFKLVLHLNETTEDGGTRTDSTSNDNDFTVTDLTEGDVDGIAAGGDDFEGTNTDELTLADNGKLDLTTFTIEVWVKSESQTNGTIIIEKRLGSQHDGYANFLIEYYNGLFYTFFGDSGTSNSALLNTAAVANGSWGHVAITMDNVNDDFILYKNGINSASNMNETKVPYTDGVQTTKIGATGSGDHGPYDGIADEVRISDIPRTAAWLKATYETTRDHILDWETEESSNTLDYSIDAIFQKLGITKTYNVDSVIKKLGVTKTYLLDTILNAIIEKPYDVDVLLMGTETKTYTIDTLLKKLGVTDAYSIDVRFLITEEKSYGIDALLKKLDIPSTYVTDVTFATVKTLAYSIDTILFKTTIKPYTLDVVFLLHQEQSYDIDVLLKKLGIQKSYITDVILKKLDQTMPYIIDVVFHSPNEVPYDVDTLFKKLGLTESYGIDVILKSSEIFVQRWLHKPRPKPVFPFLTELPIIGDIALNFRKEEIEVKGDLALILAFDVELLLEGSINVKTIFEFEIPVQGNLFQTFEYVLNIVGGIIEDFETELTVSGDFSEKEKKRRTRLQKIKDALDALDRLGRV